MPEPLDAVTMRLRAIELPDCDCPEVWYRIPGTEHHWLKPCQHVTGYGITAKLDPGRFPDAESWSSLLLATLPDEHSDRPPARKTKTLPGTSEKTRTMELRYELGVSLHHRGDVHTSDLAILRDPGRNGALGYVETNLEYDHEEPVPRLTIEEIVAESRDVWSRRKKSPLAERRAA